MHRRQRNIKTENNFARAGNKGYTLNDTQVYGTACRKAGEVDINLLVEFIPRRFLADARDGVNEEGKCYERQDKKNFTRPVHARIYDDYHPCYRWGCGDGAVCHSLRQCLYAILGDRSRSGEV